MWACYEKGSLGWQLVVYHQWKPPMQSVNGKGVERTSLFDVPKDCINEDGSVNFNKIESRVLKPEPIKFDEPKIKIEVKNAV